MNIPGCYLIVGPQDCGTVTLTASAVELYRKRVGLGGQLAAVRVTFGSAFEHAFPCWIPQVMDAVVQTYEGPHADRVKGIAAAVLLGKPYGGPERDDGPQGGSKDRMPENPKPPRGPKGRKVSALDAEAEVLFLEGLHS